MADQELDQLRQQRMAQLESQHVSSIELRWLATFIAFYENNRSDYSSLKIRTS